MTPAERKDRRERLLARMGSLAFDALLIAYALWCLSFLQAQVSGQGFLRAHPHLAWVGLFLAVLWQTTGASLGQRAYRLEFKTLAGEPAPAAARWTWGLVLGAELLVFVAAWVLLPTSWRSGLVGGLLAFLFLGWSRGYSDAEAAARVRLAIRRTEDTGAVPAWHRRPNVWAVLVLLLLTFAVGFQITDISPGALTDNIARTKPMIDRLTSPDWSIVPQVIDKLVETVFLALMASTLSLPFAFVLSFFGARNLTRGSGWGRLCYVLARVFMNVTRSIEPIVWGIIFIVWVGVGPFAGMLALFIHSVAALGKLYSEAIESIDPGPVEAIQATGANTVQVLRYGVVPQVIPPFLSFTVYRWDINVRMATILGLIGAGGIGNMLIDFTQLGAWNKVGTVILFITVVVWLMDIASAKARERLS